MEMEKFEVRRIALKALVDSLGHGGIARVAEKIGKEPNYVSRMLYGPEKKGMKRIGEDSVEALNNAFPNWLPHGSKPKTMYIPPENTAHEPDYALEPATLLARKIVSLSRSKSLKPEAIQIINELVDQLSINILTAAPADAEGLADNAVDKLTAKAHDHTKTTRQN